MKSRILTCTTAMTLFVALAVPVRFAAQTNYSVVELGELGGTAGSANGINERGWITGTDNLPVLNQQVQMPPQTHDYSGLTTPSVWRNGRTAAAKVDALASNGMDEIEIPAFLRKQAD